MELQVKIDQSDIKEINHAHRIDELSEEIRNLSRDLQMKEDTTASFAKKYGRSMEG